MITKKLKCAVVKWMNSVETVEDDLNSYIEGFNISKSMIARDVDIMKTRFSYIEELLKRRR